MSAGPQTLNASSGPGLEFLEFLASQRADYRRGLPEKSAGMATLWSLIADGHGDGSAVLELERQAHSMAGSAATFGFSDLGLAARTLELAVRPLLDCQGSPSAAQRLEIAAAMLAVKEQLPC
jgi:HPt (histidine-containing phosphotransfer) domain-containing protein